VDICHAAAEAILSMRSDAIIAADREGIIRFWNVARRTLALSLREGTVAVKIHYRNCAMLFF
jgi:hypothetical protein